jgi:hypothetical protein
MLLRAHSVSVGYFMTNIIVKGIPPSAATSAVCAVHGGKLQRLNGFGHATRENLPGITIARLLSGSAIPA